MANIREHKFTNAAGSSEQVQIVDRSPTGREQLSIFGTLGGGTIFIKKQLVLSDGTTSSVTEIAEYSDEINIQMAVGKDNNIFVEVTGMSVATDLIAKSTPLN